MLLHEKLEHYFLLVASEVIRFSKRQMMERGQKCASVLFCLPETLRKNSTCGFFKQQSDVHVFQGPTQ